jgi:hypothetical protein
MSTLEFIVPGQTFPNGGMNKAATLVTAEEEAMLVKACPTREHRPPAAEIISPGMQITTAFVSHGHGHPGEKAGG